MLRCPSEEDECPLGQFQIVECVGALDPARVECCDDGVVTLLWIAFRVVAVRLESFVRSLPDVFLAGSLVSLVGEVRRVERQVAEPGMFAVSHYEVRRGIGQTGPLSSRRDELPRHMSNRSCASVVDVRVVVDVAGRVAEEFVEAALGRSRAFAKPIFLTEAAGRVSGGLEDLRNQDFAGSQAGSVVALDAWQFERRPCRCGMRPVSRHARETVHVDEGV